MDQPNPLMHLKFQLGQSEPHQQDLLRISLANFGPEKLASIREKAKVTEQLGGDIALVFKYKVQPGREEDARAYFQGALNNTIDRSQMSPLQYITRSPQDFGNVEVRTSPGEVIVFYRIREDAIEEELRNIIIGNAGKLFSLQLNLHLRGFVSHSLKNRANVKVDYAQIDLKSDNWDSNLIPSLLSEQGLVPPEISLNPFYSCFGKPKKLNLSLRFRNFRQLSRYYDEILALNGNDNQKKKDKEDFKYQNQGIFGAEVEAYIIGGGFALTGKLHHHGEDAFMRLVKVYFKAIKKALR